MLRFVSNFAHSAMPGDMTSRNNNLSIIERLPKEVLWKIIEYAAEAMFELRLTSRLIQDRVVEVVSYKDIDMRIATELNLTEEGLKGDWVQKMAIAINVPAQNTRFFELRLKHHCVRWPSYFYDRIERTEYIDDSVVFELKFSSEYDNEWLLKYLRKCIGKNIGKVKIECESPKLLEIICSLTDRFQFNNLEFIADKLSEENSNTLLEIINHHGVEQLALSIRANEIPIGKNNAVAYLYKLADAVKSLQLTQFMDALVPTSVNFMFGKRDLKWPSIIVNMFSRKLDKLRIINNFYPSYLPSDAIDELCEQLLLDKKDGKIKKMWLTASCVRPTRKLSYWNNFHHVEAVQCADCWELKVRHAERLNEVFL